jgi:hypothetical protein
MSSREPPPLKLITPVLASVPGSFAPDTLPERGQSVLDEPTAAKAPEKICPALNNLEPLSKLD